MLSANFLIGLYLIPSSLTDTERRLKPATRFQGATDGITFLLMCGIMFAGNAYFFVAGYIEGLFYLGFALMSLWALIMLILAAKAIKRDAKIASFDDQDTITTTAAVWFFSLLWFIPPIAYCLYFLVSAPTTFSKRDAIEFSGLAFFVLLLLPKLKKLYRRDADFNSLENFEY
ncbi:MAG: hypothetical protein WKF91_13535 [Segetibacter sp.]